MQETKEKCDIPTLISNFNNIDTNSSKLSELYTVAWKYYQDYVNQNYNKLRNFKLLDESNIKFLIDNGVDINNFYSCAIYKFNNFDIENMYNILSTLNINITAIYLNNLDLGNILYHMNSIVRQNDRFKNSKVKENSDSNAKVITNTEDDFTVYPYPMTNDFIRKIIKKDYPKMPEYKLNRLMKEYEMMDKSDWVEGEILFPSCKKLPEDFWNFSKI